MQKKRNIIFLVITCLFAYSCYSQIKPTNQGKNKLYQVVKNYKDDKMGFINLSSNIAIPCIYDWVKEFNEGFAVFSQNDKMGLINTKGVVVIEPDYKYLGTMSEGLIAFKEDKKYGYLNSQGQVVISNIYDKANLFSEGLAAVSINNKTGYINKQGKLIIPQKFASAYTFREGLAKVRLEEKDGWLDGGYIDKTGRLVIACNFYTGNDNTSREEDGFYGGVARASLDGETWGFINKMGKFVINPIYSGASDFKEGLASVWKDHNSTMGYINISGKIIIPIDYKGGEAFSDGIAKVIVANENGYDWTYINKKGEYITELRHGQYGVATNYKDGLARVFNENGESYYIDKTGKYFHSYYSEDLMENTTNFKIGDEYYYTGILKNGLPDGQGKWTKSDGSWHEGEFKQGQENGKGTRRMTDGKRYYGYFVDGKSNGVFEVKQWTLGGLMSNEWYAEYDMGNLVSSQKTKDDFDKFLSGGGSSTNSSQNNSSNNNQKSVSNSSDNQVKIVEIEIKKSGKSCCAYKSESYCFDIYEDGKKLNGVDTRTISKADNSYWVTDCGGGGSWKVCDNVSYTEALKNYYRKKYKKEPQKFKITE